MPRYALRVDSNQDAVLSALEAAGAQVEVISKPVDLLVGGIAKDGTKKMMLMEVKDGPKKRKTTYQKGLFERWEGYPLCLVDGPEAAVRMYRVLIA